MCTSDAYAQMSARACLRLRPLGQTKGRTNTTIHAYEQTKTVRRTNKGCARARPGARARVGVAGPALADLSPVRVREYQTLS